MPIDPSIALGFRPPEQPSQINMLAQALQLQGLQRQNQMGALDMKDREAAAAERDALRNYLSGGANLDTPEGQSGLYKVAPTQAAPILKGRLELGKLQGEMGKTSADTERIRAQTEGEKFKNRQALITQNLQVLGSVSSPEQAAQWIQGGVQSGLIDGNGAQNSMAELQAALKAGPQGFAQWKQQQMQAGMTIAQQMEQQWKAQEFGLKKDQFGESQRHNKATEGASWANVNIAKERLKLDQTAPKGVLDPERGLIVDPRTGEGKQITLNGAPVGMKQDAATKKELTSLNQQDAIIQGAIDAVRKTPSAFTFKRGLATMAGPLSESAVGRLDSKDEQAARAYVFNNVSKVINERAGAAQSAQELARLRGFLPAETDSPEQVVNKLEAFQAYVADMRTGTTPAATKAAPSAPKPGMVQDGWRFKGGNPADPKNWEKQ